MKRSSMIFPRAALVAAILATLLIGAVARAAEPLTIRVGWGVLPGELPPILFAKQGIARHLGQSYRMAAIHFAGSSPMITAIAAKDIDIAPLAFSSFALAVENARLDDLKIISDEYQDGVDGYNTNQYMVLRESPILRVEDLKGKVVAVNAFGAAVDAAMRVMLRRHGLEDKRDYSTIEVAFANMPAVLAAHKADLITASLPFSRDPGLRAMARTLFTQKEAIGRTQMLVFTARAGFLAENRPAVVDFMEDYLRALHWYIDPDNQAEAAAILARYTKQPEATFIGWVYGKGDKYRDPQGLPDLDALQRNIDTLRELGFLKSALEVRNYTDLSIVEEAAARLKP